MRLLLSGGGEGVVNLPEAIASLRTRTLSAVAIDDTPARSQGALQGLGWPMS